MCSSSFLQLYMYLCISKTSKTSYKTDQPATTSKKPLGFFMALPGTPRNGSDLRAGMLRSSEGLCSAWIFHETTKGVSEQYSTFNLT